MERLIGPERICGKLTLYQNKKVGLCADYYKSMMDCIHSRALSTS